MKRERINFQGGWLLGSVIYMNGLICGKTISTYICTIHGSYGTSFQFHLQMRYCIHPATTQKTVFSEEQNPPTPNMFIRLKEDAIFKLKRCWRVTCLTAEHHQKHQGEDI